MTKRIRFWVEAGTAALATALALLTLVSRAWVELAFGVDPDGGSGVAEWGVTLALLGVALAAGGLAGREWARVPRTA